MRGAARAACWKARARTRTPRGRRRARTASSGRAAGPRRQVLRRLPGRRFDARLARLRAVRATLLGAPTTRGVRVQVPLQHEVRRWAPASEAHARVLARPGGGGGGSVSGVSSTSAPREHVQLPGLKTRTLLRRMVGREAAKSKVKEAATRLRRRLRAANRNTPKRRKQGRGWRRRSEAAGLNTDADDVISLRGGDDDAAVVDPLLADLGERDADREHRDGGLRQRERALRGGFHGEDVRRMRDGLDLQCRPPGLHRVRQQCNLVPSVWAPRRVQRGSSLPVLDPLG